MPGDWYYYRVFRRSSSSWTGKIRALLVKQWNCALCMLYLNSIYNSNISIALSTDPVCSSLQLRKSALHLLLGLFPKCLSQDLPRWILWNWIQENYAAGDSLDSRHFAFHESGDILSGCTLPRCHDDICSGSLIVVPVLLSVFTHTFSNYRV